MSGRKKKQESKPSKAYLVSFGDTMTALLAFFIVLNSLAKDQTGAKMYSGTGSFMNAMKSLGVPGDFSGARSSQLITKNAPSPIYVVRNDKENPNRQKGSGPDEDGDKQRIINRQSDNFQRYLNEMERRYAVNEHAPTRSQFVLDSWEKLGGTNQDLLGNKNIQMITDAITQIGSSDVEIELIVWANMPSPLSLKQAIDRAQLAQEQFDQLFMLNDQQRSQIRFSAKPWLFVNAKRPIVSLVISRMAAH